MKIIYAYGILNANKFDKSDISWRKNPRTKDCSNCAVSLSNLAAFLLLASCSIKKRYKLHVTRNMRLLLVTGYLSLVTQFLTSLFSHTIFASMRFDKNMSHRDRIIISVGGSLIVPNTGIDITFLNKLSEFIRTQLASHPNRQFFLVIGGGATARHYRDAGREVVHHELTRDDLDWLGIHSTRLNAQLLRTIFRDIAHPFIIKNYEIIRKVSEPVIVAAGWKPGFSTDYCAVMLCEDYGIKTVINLSNITQVYDKDPNKNKDAKPFSEITWEEFRKLVGNEWDPGMHAPFDPIASKKAEELGVKVVVMGSDFKNLEQYLQGKKSVGTVIE